MSLKLLLFRCLSICSAESGFSDERGDDTDEEDDAMDDRIRLGLRRRSRKVTIYSIVFGSIPYRKNIFIFIILQYLFIILFIIISM